MNHKSTLAMVILSTISYSPLKSIAAQYNGVFNGNDSLSLNRNDTLSDFTLNDSASVIAKNFPTKINNGTLNNSSTLIVAGGFVGTIPTHQNKVENIEFNDTSSIKYSNAVIMNNLTFRGNSSLSELTSASGMPVYAGSWINVDSISAYDNSHLAFTFGVIDQDGASISNINLFDNSQLLIDGKNTASTGYVTERLSINGLTANNNSDITLKNKLIASNITLHNNSTISIENETSVNGLTISDNTVATATSGSLVNNLTMLGSATMNITDGAHTKNNTLYGGQLNIINGTAEETTINEQGHVVLWQDGNLQGNTNINGGALAINGEKMSIGGSADTIFLNDSTSLLKINGTDNTISNIEFNAGYIDTTNKSKTSSLHNTLNISKLTGNGGTFVMASNFDHYTTDFINIAQGYGNHNILVLGSGSNPLKQGNLDIINVDNGNASFNLANNNGVVDIGTYQYQLNSNKNSVGGDTWFLSPTRNLTASAQSMLSMASTSVFIMEGELQSLRFRHNDLRSNIGENNGFWARSIINDTRMSPNYGGSFNLEQRGVELGSDKVINLETGGNVVVGGLLSYTDNSLDHHKSGSGRVESYGLGAYATIFGDSGVYFDSVLKYNKMRNTLTTKMNDGVSGKGDYSQSGISLSLESGLNKKLTTSFWVEPYIRASFLTSSGFNAKLTNGMSASSDRTNSIKGELGTSIGGELETANGSKIKPYIKLAIENEFVNSNKVTINRTDSLNNDFSGSAGKFGLGVQAKTTNNTSVYAEVDYRKGSKVESPVIANIGFRVSF